MEEAGIKEGDEIDVKLIDIDPKTGKFKLSRKVLLPRPETVSYTHLSQKDDSEAEDSSIDIGGGKYGIHIRHLIQLSLIHI